SLLFITTLPTRSTLFPYTTLFRSIADNFQFFPLYIGKVDYPVLYRNRHADFRLIRKRYFFFCFCLPIVCNQFVRRNSFSIIIARSEEHTSELQSRFDLVCRLLLEK